MRTIFRSAVLSSILILAFLATPGAQPANIIARTGEGWLVGAASDGSAVLLGADGVGYLKVSPGGATSYVNGGSIATAPVQPSTCTAPAIARSDALNFGIAFDSTAPASVNLCAGGLSVFYVFNSGGGQGGSGGYLQGGTDLLPVGAALWAVQTGTIGQYAIVADHSAGGTAVRYPGFAVKNSEAAINGTVQFSPSIDWYGSGYKTGPGQGSKTVRYFSYVETFQSASNPIAGILHIGYDYTDSSGSAANVVDINELGLAVTGGISASTGFEATTGNINALAGEIQTAGVRLGYNKTTGGAGTAYSLTNSAAAIDFGTTDPVIVLDQAGTYNICAQVNLAYNGATVTTQTATIKVRRTNNTAADLSVVPVLDLPVATTLTHTYGIFQIPCVVYTTAATDDSITIFANVNAALGAGTLDATAIGTSIQAIRLY